MAIEQNLLVEGTKHKFSLEHELVRQNQPVIVPLYHFSRPFISSCIHQDIQVDVPGTLINDLDTTHTVLY